MLNAHMDTVGVVGMTDPFSARLEGDRLYGRGRARHERQPRGVHACGRRREAAAGSRGDVIVTAVSDEEFASVGTEADRRLAARGCRDRDGAHGACRSPSRIVASSISRSRRSDALRTGRVRTSGIDAIAKMGRVLTGIERARSPASRRADPDPYLGSGSAARVADRRRAGVLELSGALRAPGRAADDPGRDRRARGRRDPGDPRRGGRCGPRLRGQRSLARVTRAVRGRGGRGGRQDRSPLCRADPRVRAGGRRRVVLGRFGAPRRSRDSDRAVRAARRRAAHRGRVGRRRVARAVRRDLRRGRLRDLPG